MFLKEVNTDRIGPAGLEVLANVTSKGFKVMQDCGELSQNDVMTS